MASQPTDARGILARRLRQLREEHWVDTRVTQRTLAHAFGVSEALVSSWESLHDPVVPPRERIASYATFFASTRSVGRTLLRPNELDGNEQAARATIHEELTRLRDEAAREDVVTSTSAGALQGSWHFPDGGPIRIVCSEVPAEQRNPDSTPAHPTFEYGEVYSYGNIDALFELHGHIRAANPLSDVRIRKDDQMTRDDYSAHLVVLGGVDWNQLTQRLQNDSSFNIPVRQVSTGDDPATAYFEVPDDPDAERYGATVAEGRRGERELLSDVGYFLRVPSPFNRRRALSVCNGHFSLGTYGIVRSLTDKDFREQNDEFLRRRFAGADGFCVLMRIEVLNGDKAVTPDLTAPATLLRTWPEASQ